MTAIRETILAALAARLAVVDGVTLFERNRQDETTPASLPALLLFDGAQRAAHENSGRVDYAMDVSIEGHVRAADGAALGGALNALYAAALRAVLDPAWFPAGTLDAREIDLNVDLWRGDGGAPQAVFVLTIEISFWTSDADPALAGP